MAVLAIDLGASSGRGIVVDVINNNMTCTEVHRFSNGAIGMQGGLYWDIDHLFSNIKLAIKKATQHASITSLSIDTWGVDYAFVNRDGSVEPAHSYRDARTAGIIDSFSPYTKKELFDIAGISLNEFNTSYQLSTENKSNKEWDNIETFLFIPSLFAYLLTGKLGVEPTIASTSGFYNLEGFSTEFLRKIKLDERLLPPVYNTGHVLGKIKEDIARELNLPYDIDVVLGAGHDTACAVASIPSLEEGNLFLSSGTWSLFGTELPAKNTSQQAYLEGFTNELGVSSVRFLKNITGLWLIQECKKEWEKNRELSFSDIVEECINSPKRGAYVNVADSIFSAPDNMPERIVSYVERTQGIRLNGIGEIADTIYRSLAMEYKHALIGLQAITNREYTKLHVIGGGANNLYLNQLTADALGIPVVAGPTEATAIGNAIVQMIAGGQVPSLKSARELIRNTVPLKTFEPSGGVDQEEYQKYLKLKKS